MVAVYTCRRNTYVTKRTFCVSVTSTTPRRWHALLFTKGARIQTVGIHSHSCCFPFMWPANFPLINKQSSAASERSPRRQQQCSLIDSLLLYLVPSLYWVAIENVCQYEEVVSSSRNAAHPREERLEEAPWGRSCTDELNRGRMYQSSPGHLSDPAPD